MDFLYKKLISIIKEYVRCVQLQKKNYRKMNKV